jgi:hypothetical protein
LSIKSSRGRLGFDFWQPPEASATHEQ